MLLQPLTFEDSCCCLFQRAFNILSHLSFMRTPCIIFYFQEHEIMPLEEDNTLVGYTSLIYPDFCLVPLSHSHQPRLLNHDALRLSDLWARKKDLLLQLLLRYLVAAMRKVVNTPAHVLSTSPTGDPITTTAKQTGEGSIRRWKPWMEE